ncbi:MAG: hypothetical protein ACREUT_04935 [Steroidobacteraceae bacterium]
MSCANAQEGAPDDGEGTGYTCLYHESPTGTSLDYTGVGYQYVTGDTGPYHAMYLCNCNHGGVDLGVARGGTVSEALDWSGNIIFVGFGDAADGVTHGLVWPNGAGSATILPMPPGVDPHTPSKAYAVDSAGEIVGSYSLADDPQNVGSRAVLWEPDATAPDGSGYVAYDLTSLLPSSASGLVLGSAYAIGCTGDVAADGTPAKWQSDPQTASLTAHRYVVLRDGGNGASCSP